MQQSQGSFAVADRIEGLWSALATPLTADGLVDHAALVRHGNDLIAQGCDGLVLFGTTGEGPSFSTAERLATLEAMLTAGISPAKLCLSTGFPAITDSIAVTKAMLGLGLTHALILPPYFFRDAPDEGLQDAFSAIIDGVGEDRLRVTLYHIPQVSGVAVTPRALATLRARHGVVLAGVKDSTGDFSQFCQFRAACPEAGVLVGNEADIGRALAEGGAGTICGMVNVVPGLVRAMFTEPGAAGPMQQAIAQMTGGFVPTLKSALAAMTGEPGWARVRAPLRPVAAATGEKVAATFRRLLVQKAA
jgi:4-hydroxy-tetrahydrodipicolinate synthase